MSRANRRRQYRRLKKKRASYWGGGYENPRHQGMKVSAPKLKSSCMCCMNQRKLYGETRQEQVFLSEEPELTYPRCRLCGHIIIASSQWQGDDVCDQCDDDY